MAQADGREGPGELFFSDGWDGYPAARQRLLDLFAQRVCANPVVLGGDVHSFWVADLKPDFDDARSPDRGERIRRHLHQLASGRRAA
jgi:alkaline phosphatase D